MQSETFRAEVQAENSGSPRLHDGFAGAEPARRLEMEKRRNLIATILDSNIQLSHSTRWLLCLREDFATTTKERTIRIQTNYKIAHKGQKNRKIASNSISNRARPTHIPEKSFLNP
jgi:hypothetical protein